MTNPDARIDKHTIVCTDGRGKPFYEIPWNRDLVAVIGKLAGIMTEERARLQASVDTVDMPDIVVFSVWQRNVEDKIKLFAESLKITL